ncbi:unnamed protein product, partial [marine sediment metagenome]
MTSDQEPVTGLVNDLIQAETEYQALAAQQKQAQE